MAPKNLRHPHHLTALLRRGGRQLLTLEGGTGFSRAGRAAPRDFPQAAPSRNPLEQPCQHLENPLLPNSFTQIYILFQIGFCIGPLKMHRQFHIGLPKLHKRFLIGPPDWLGMWPFSSQSSKHHNSQTVRARELKFWENAHPPPHVTCHVSRVTCRMSHITRHM